MIIFTGAGERAFIAGGDIADLNSRGGLAHYQEFAEVVHRVFRRIELSDKPTIAAVNGFALGGGSELILATDIRILADTARLGLPEITLGLFPGAGGTQRMIRQVAPCRAKRSCSPANRSRRRSSLPRARQQGGAGKERDNGGARFAAKIAAKWPLMLKLLKRTLSPAPTCRFRPLCPTNRA